MNNEKGITLVELLATLTITSLIVIFIVSTQMMIQNQYKTQTDNTEKLTDITIAMKSITRDLRSAETVNISDDHTSIKINNEIEYKLIGETLQKNGMNYLYDITRFQVKENEDVNGKIEILIKSNNGKLLKTEIVLREGDVDEGSEDE